MSLKTRIKEFQPLDRGELIMTVLFVRGVRLIIDWGRGDGGKEKGREKKTEANISTDPNFSGVD